MAFNRLPKNLKVMTFSRQLIKKKIKNVYCKSGYTKFTLDSNYITFDSNY